VQAPANLLCLFLPFRFLFYLFLTASTLFPFLLSPPFLRRHCNNGSNIAALLQSWANQSPKRV
jgi:hypothetical protein